MTQIHAWLVAAADRSILQRSLVTALIVGGILALINHGPEIFDGTLEASRLWRIALTMLVPFCVATVAGVAAKRRQQLLDEEMLRQRERQVESMKRFPNQNPNPVLRASNAGLLLYANEASQPILTQLGARVDEPLSPDFFESVQAMAAGERQTPLELVCGVKTFSVLAVQVAELGFINIYGTDITALKVINKFPAQNPNPVLKVSPQGRLLYANPAATRVKQALKTEPGEALPADFLRTVQALSEGTGPATTELQSDGHIFELVAVPITEFDFINIYGTDVTAVRQLEVAHRENERLLLNILPPDIAERLRGGEELIADRFQEVSILFADVVGFTELSTRLSATELVNMLNRLFSLFDELAEQHGIEKIKTIGDAYMAVAGLTENPTGHAERIADMALAMIDAVGDFRTKAGGGLDIRVGMNTGPAVAGVIGLKKFIFDVWGDAVNTASRMESQGVPGRVHVTQNCYERLRRTHDFEPRGTFDVKGKGPMATYLLRGRILPS